MTRIFRFIKANGLSLAFVTLFVSCLVGHLLATAWEAAENPAAQVQRTDPAGVISSADFLRGVFGNWQAAVLQLFVLIVLTVFLRQRGASHSRKTEDDGRHRADRLRWCGAHHRWAYSNSLSLAFSGCSCSRSRPSSSPT